MMLLLSRDIEAFLPKKGLKHQYAVDEAVNPANVDLHQLNY